MSRRCFTTWGLSTLIIPTPSGLKLMAPTQRAQFLRSHGIPEPKADLVWEAIALHTTPGIPQYMRPEIALTNAGVLVDVVGIGYDEYTPEQRDEVIAAFPRGDFKNEFIQVQTHSALKKPQTTFGTVNVDYIEYCDHTFRKPNACTRIRNTPWHS